jgi:hypothetical protein
MDSGTVSMLYEMVHNWRGSELLLAGDGKKCFYSPLLDTLREVDETREVKEIEEREKANTTIGAGRLNDLSTPS